MTYYYFLWAIGKDRPGIVAGISRVLFQKTANIEDSSMMRLGSEFGVFMIFTSSRHFEPIKIESWFKVLRRDLSLTLGVKEISKELARFTPNQQESVKVTVYGPDSRGIVFKVTSILAKHNFNIIDLNTHRTTTGEKPGYILIIEGELKSKINQKRLESSLIRLGHKFKTKINISSTKGEAL